MVFMATNVKSKSRTHVWTIGLTKSSQYQENISLWARQVRRSRTSFVISIPRKALHGPSPSRLMWIMNATWPKNRLQRIIHENEQSGNWRLFRLPKSAMTEIESRSKFWRATCAYSVYGIDFRDYIRVRLSIMNPLTYTSTNSNASCLPVDYIDIKGTNCKGCTQFFYQKPSVQLLYLNPHKSRVEHRCNFDTSKVEHKCEAAPNKYARLLGSYEVPYSDTGYRCSENSKSTTEFWFGAIKEK